MGTEVVTSSDGGVEVFNGFTERVTVQDNYFNGPRTAVQMIGTDGYVIDNNEIIGTSEAGHAGIEIDAGYGVQWYAPDAGWYVAAQTYDAKGNLMYNSILSSFQFANAATTNDQNAPVWTNGDFWNFSISMPTFFGVTYEEYHQMTVTGTDCPVSINSLVIPIFVPINPIVII